VFNGKRSARNPKMSSLGRNEARTGEPEYLSAAFGNSAGTAG
jgi:hypothetical protein